MGTRTTKKGHQEQLNDPRYVKWYRKSRKVIGPYFFEKKAIKGNTCSNILITSAFLNFARLRNDYIIMNECDPSHTMSFVRQNLSRESQSN